jgi:hypothetical protein
MMLNPIFELLTEEEQDELIRAGLACCGSYDSESGCCPFTHRDQKADKDKQSENNS